MAKSTGERKAAQRGVSRKDCEKCEIVIQLRSEAGALEERETWRRQVIKRMRNLLWQCKTDNRAPTDDEMNSLCAYELEVGRNFH